jgi:hypothetical protein
MQITFKHPERPNRQKTSQLESRRNPFCFFDPGSRPSTLSEGDVRSAMRSLGGADTPTSLCERLSVIILNLESTPCHCLSELGSVPFIETLVSAQRTFMEDLDCTAVVFSCAAHLATVSDECRCFLASEGFLDAASECVSSEHSAVCLWSVRLFASLVDCAATADVDVGMLLCRLTQATLCSNAHCEAVAHTLLSLVSRIPMSQFGEAIEELLLNLVASNPPDSVIWDVSETCRYLLSVDAGLFPLLDEVIEQLVEELQSSIVVVESRISLPLLELVRFILRTAPPQIGRRLATKVPPVSYHDAILDSYFETGEVALDIVAWLLCSGDEKFREYFSGTDAITRFHDHFYETGPFFAQLAWIKFCYAMMTSKLWDVVERLLTAEFPVAFTKCVAADSPEMVGYFLATVLLMIEAVTAPEEAQNLRDSLTSVDGLLDEVEEFLANTLAEAQFVLDLPHEGDRPPVALRSLAELVLAFVGQEADD